jgi:uncharacterized RDD family membrane protein YckC
MNNVSSQSIAYPRLLRRTKAVMTDAVILPVAVIASLFLGDALGVTNTSVKVASFVLPIFILEPGMVALTGGTIGHHLFGLRVARLDGKRRINLFAAIIRFAVKLVLSWVSFIVVLTTKKHQAVHDLLARSVVVHVSPEGLPAREVLAERSSPDAKYSYPSAWRRVGVIGCYWIIATTLIGMVSNLVASKACIQGVSCTTLEYFSVMGFDLAWLLSVGWLTVQGWNGLLFGCMRRLLGTEKDTEQHSAKKAAATTDNAE